MPRTITTTEGRTFARTCPECGTKFKSDNARTKYCSIECKRIAGNRRYYEQHGETVSARNNERQKQQRARLAELESNEKGE